MPRRVIFSDQSISILDVAAYHQDADASLRMLFTNVNPHFSTRFIGYIPEEISAELDNRLEETDVRSSFAVLARVEAAFRIDYLQRCQNWRRDALSREFRQIHKTFGPNVRLEDGIFELWRQHHPVVGQLISELRGAFRFRHWLAHGSYWVPKRGRKYDYRNIYALADAVFVSFPLYGRDR